MGLTPKIIQSQGNNHQQQFYNMFKQNGMKNNASVFIGTKRPLTSISDKESVH